MTALRVGIVAIGRNEGARLGLCLQAIRGSGVPAVYVDSGSQDGSVRCAEMLGFTVLSLDPIRPFSAARARNEGFAWLLATHPGLECVQFIDGDCELLDCWLTRGADFLAGRPDVSAVCGRVRERHPEANVYTRMCSMEWERAVGEVNACGGNMMVRVEAFREVGGFREDVIAAEDDEFCLRLRQNGGRLFHLDAPMVLHDVAMTRFGQWWQRSRRTGYAYAQGVDLHGRSQDRHFVKEARSILLWGLGIPMACIVAGIATNGMGLLLLAAYPLQVVRIYQHGRRRGWQARDAELYACFTVLAKFPELAGLIEYRRRRLLGRPTAIIEHKNPGRTA